MAEQELEVYRQSRQQQDKYVYFLLAAAGAAMAFAMTQTKEAALQISHWPLFAALAAWAISFLFGCATLSKIEQVLNLNQQLLKIQKGTHPLLEHRAEIPAATEIMMDNVNKANGGASSRSRWQFRFLVIGAGFYIGWHVYEMYLRSLA